MFHHVREGGSPRRGTEQRLGQRVARTGREARSHLQGVDVVAPRHQFRAPERQGACFVEDDMVDPCEAFEGRRGEQEDTGA